MNKIFFLKNSIQEYSWGSMTAIPELLGEPVAQEPQAEMWMGAHPGAPSQVLYEEVWISLADLIKKKPGAILGKSVSERFSQKLPFLFKVLAAAKPLSIQAHPNLEQARQGFIRENALGININAPDRNYRDDNHKPEIICALTPFRALTGFRKITNILSLMEKISASSIFTDMKSLQRQPDSKGLECFFKKLMNMDRDRKSQLVTEVVKFSEKNTAADPAFEWIVRLNKEYPGDIGVLAPLLLNLVQLKPGEGLFLQAGDLHAYLDGVGIELMANSDNVLRGGLTSKHIDAPELMNILNFTEKDVNVLNPIPVYTGERIYQTESEEFFLSVISVNKKLSYKSPVNRGVEIMICTEGDTVINYTGGKEDLPLTKGKAVIVPASVEQYVIDGDGTIYKAGVPGK